MADAQSSSKQSGATRGKLILVAVLAVVLIVVLFIQFGSSGGKTVPKTVASRAPRPVPASHPSSKTKSTTKGTADTLVDTGVVAPIINPATWKSPPLDAVAAYDPFALPPTFPQPKLATGEKAVSAEGLIAAAAADDAQRMADSLRKLQSQLEELKRQGVHVIVREQDHYAAMIGDRMLHVGDKINGFTVTAISPDGVRVERDQSP